MRQARLIRAFDLILAVVLVALLAPVFALVTLLVWGFLGRPVLHVSRREGLGGVEYDHYKFRSMLPGTEFGRVFFEQGRLTRFGRFLRACHLDELPELLLIVFGKMSFVGPRPLPRALLEGLDATTRRRVPPGWTGPAQIQLLTHGALDKQRQIELDNRYVHQRSLAHNLRLLGRTLVCLLRRKAPNLDPCATRERAEFGNKHRCRQAPDVTDRRAP